MRRPLLWALCLVVLWILCFYDPPEDNNIREETATFTAQVAELIGWGDDTSLIVCDVTTDDGKSYCRKLQVYATENYNTKEKKCSFSHLKTGNIIQIQGKVKPFREPGNPGQFNEIKYYQSLNVDARFYADSALVIRDDVNMIADFLHNLRGWFRDAFFQALPDREAGVLSAMILGEKSGLEDEVKELYRENGIAHILAISGLHVSLIGLGLFNLLRRYIMPMQIAAVVTGVILFLYGELTGFPVSTRRAVVMTVLILIARLLGERFDRLNALAFSAIIELIIHPESLSQSGFLLSYGTVLGITLFVDEFRNIKIASDKSVIQMCFKFISGSIGVFLITLPILIQSYHEVAVFSIPVNALILPFMSILIGMSLVGGGLGLLSAVVSRFAFGIVYYLLQGIEMICGWVAMIPCHTVIIGHRSVAGVVFYYLVILGVVVYIKNRQNVYKLFMNIRDVFVRQKTSSSRSEMSKERSLNVFHLESLSLKNESRRRGVIVFVILLVDLIVFILPVTTSDSEWLPAFSQNGMTITNLDIGQGDCSVIRTPDDRVILIDGGSSDVKSVGKYRIVPYLKYMGISRIDAIILTHSDEDHLSGLTEILEKDDHFGLEIGQVYMPEIQDPDINYVQFAHIVEKSLSEESDPFATIDTDSMIQAGTKLDSEKDMNRTDNVFKLLEMETGMIQTIETGDILRYGEVTLTCLHPSSTYEWEDVNDYSTVIELSYGNFKGIFTGDLGIHGEEALAGELSDTGMALEDVDYLKVGHHGSKYSSSDAFLSTIKPEIAVASAGINNRYHHPSPEAVERITQSGASFFCTNETGAVTIWTDGEHIRIDTFC